MNGREHYKAAEAELATAWGSAWEDAPVRLAKAQVHATLALFDMVREIGDQLDTMPRRAQAYAPPPECPVECSASGSCEVCR